MDIRAYRYEYQYADGGRAPATHSWKTAVKEIDPESIENIEVRNLQRLVLIDEVDVSESEAVASLLEIDHGNDGETDTAVTRDTNPEESIRQSDSVADAHLLVPHPEDVGDGPEPEPLRPRGGADYYVDREEATYYRVDVVEDEAERSTPSGEISPARVVDVWHLEQAGKVDTVPYADTPFSDSKY